MQRIDGVLNGIDYHQFYLVTDDDPNAIPDGAFTDEISPHTLIVPTGSALCVTTGIAMGVIKLTIELLDSPPDSINDREPWQAISEVSFEADSAEAYVYLIMDPTPTPFDAFHLSNGPGWYRARGHANGRSLDFDIGVLENPREAHLIQLWRAEGFEPARHHRVDNRWANQGSR